MSLDVNKRFLVLSLCLVFALSFIWSLHVVSANQISDTLSNVWSSIFSDSWKSGALDIETARWAYFILLAILIWAILDYAPFFNTESGKKVNPFVALIVAYLAMAYLTPEEVYTALLSYGALGIVLGGALPFVILAFFSIKISKDGGLAGRLLAKFMWFAFIIFLIVRTVVVASGNGPANVGADESYAKFYLILIGLALVWVWKVEKWVVKMLLNEDVLVYTVEEIDDKIVELENKLKNYIGKGSLSAKQEENRKKIEKELKKYNALKAAHS